jgi:methylenetetrahydrofolate dehydrogenase (NADP+)/methenyltetrahydrofolate cyclohydrolase
VLDIVDQLNADAAVHGILVQLPLPKHINTEKVLNRVNPAKDVDGFHPQNVGKLVIGDPTALRPCTPYGVQQMLLRSGIETKGAHAVVVGRSTIVGKPMANLLIQTGPGGDATVTVCHSKTRDLPGVCRSADILIAAIGKAEFVTRDFIQPGAVIIDVGINRVDDAAMPRGYRLAGDVAYAECAEIASAITPVPGGVGPMTIAMLMQNTLQAMRQAVR